MLRTFPKPMTDSVLLATPGTEIRLVSPLGLETLSVKPTRKSKTIQRLVIESEGHKGPTGRRDIDQTKPTEVDTMRNHLSDNMLPGPLKAQFQLDDVASLRTERAKLIRNQALTGHGQAQRLGPVQLDDRKGIWREVRLPKSHRCNRGSPEVQGAVNS